MPDGFDPSKFGGGSQNSSDDTGANGNPASDGSGNSGNRPSMGISPVASQEAQVNRHLCRILHCMGYLC